MEIHINKFGYIEEGTVSLDRNLTVLIGKNQTGKTYLNYALFSLLDYKGWSLPHSLLKPYVDELTETEFCRIDLTEFFNPDNQQQINTELSQELTNQLADIFASSPQFFSETKLEIALNYQNLSENLKLASKERRFMNPVVTASISDERCLDIKIRRKDLLIRTNLQPFLYDYLTTAFLNILFPKTYFALAERSAFNLFHQEFKLLLRGNFRKRKTNRLTPNDIFNGLPYPILSYLQESGRKPKSGSPFNPAISGYLEGETLKGSVRQDAETGAFYFTTTFRDGKEQELPLQMTASAVKSLAHLSVLIKDQLLPGNFLFIDEPEINLHPDNQYYLARVLAMLANQGIKVVVSTHSLTFLQEINNLIMLGQLNPSRQKEEIIHQYGYSKEMELNSEGIRAYLFNDEHKIVEIPIDEVGIDTRNSLEAVLNRLNKSTHAIYHQLNEQQANESDSI